MNLDADPRVAAVEGNLAAFHSVLMTLPPMVVEQQPDVTAFRSGFAHPLFNGVVGARFAPGTEPARAAATVAPFVERELPFLWWCGPSTWSEALARALTELGMLPEDAPGMHADLAEPAPATPLVPGLEITMDADTVAEDAARIMCDVFEIPVELTGAIRELITIDPPHLVNAVATLDGEQVACGTLWITGRTAGLYNIATLPAARRKGVGYAVTAALMAEGRARGCVDSILCASPMGLPVYRRLGFVEVCPMPQYVWVPGH